MALRNKHQFFFLFLQTETKPIMPKIVAIFSFCLISIFGYSQDWDHYQPIKAKGEVPQLFTEAFSAKYEHEVSSISKDDESKKRKNKFHRQSEYFIDEYLTGGKVFFGDTITNYCRSVLDRLIGDDEELRNSIHLFTTKSPVVNATATANGIIFVNLGLIAQLETEAQLAYILSHELIHYTNNHVIDQYIEEEKIYDGEDLYRKADDDEKLEALSSYSKNQESEADREGYKRFFSKSGYNLSSPFEVLDILQYAYLPFDEIPFEKSFFESADYIFPDDYFLEEVASIKAVDDYDDENSTHPNLLKRRKKLQRLVKKKGGKDFLISKEAFLFCRKTARFEQSRLFLTHRNYPQAIYNSFLLLKKYPENRYLRMSVAKALHGLSVYSNEGDLYDIMDDFEDIEGESQQIYYFLDQISSNELATLTLFYTHNLKKDFPEDEDIDRLYTRAINTLIFENELEPDDFFYEAKDSLVSKTQHDIDSIQKSYRADSKVARIKSKERNVQIKGDEFYWKYAFVNSFTDSIFASDFETAYELYEDDSTYYTSTYNNTRKLYDENLTLGINKAVCVTPQYLRLDTRSDGGIRFISTEKGLVRYNRFLNELSSKVKLDLDLLDYKGSHKIDAKDFNTISILKSWIAERFAHVNHDVILSDFDYVKNLKEDLGTPYVISTGNLSIRESQSVGGKLCYAALVPFYLPVALMDFVQGEYSSFNYFFVFDITNGDALMAEYNQYRANDSPDYLKSMIYNYLLQVTDQPKK